MDQTTPAAAAGLSTNALDLDRLFHEGDDQTWDMEDWNWDPYQILADPKGSPARTNPCQGLKRHKSDHALRAAAANGAAAAASTASDTCCASGVAGSAGGCAAPGSHLDASAFGGCHAGIQLPLAMQLPLQQQMQQMQQMQEMQQMQAMQQMQQQAGQALGAAPAAAQLPALANLSDATWMQQLQQQALLAQMMMQQQQLQQQQLQGAPMQATANGGAAADSQAGMAAGVAGSSSGSGAAVAGGGLHTRCQALANGLPFLSANGMALLQQQQQQTQQQCHTNMQAGGGGCGSLDRSGSIASFTAGGTFCLDLSGLPHPHMTAHMLEQQQQQQQQFAMPLPPPAQQLAAMQASPANPAAGAAPAGASASVAGLDCSSVADSGSEGGPAATQQQQQQQAVAGLQPLLLPQAHMPCLPVAAGASASLAGLTSPGTMTSAVPSATAGHHLPAPASTAADSEAVVSTAPPPPAAAAKQAAAAAAGGRDEGCEDDGRLVCQVPGCGRDLAGLKDYHQRYRICDVHIKLPQVMKDGRLQRFCQQCGRFHDLAAFDGNRKSCREQLQKHNARRRRRAQLEQNATLADSLLSAVDDKSEVGKLLSGLLSNPFQLQALRVLLGVQTHPALPAPGPAPAEHLPALAAAGALPGGAAAAAAAAGPPPSYELARDIMDGAGGFGPTFDSSHRVLRLSAKMFNVTPAELPPDLKAQLTSWLAAAPAALEGYIRPGCVLLNLHITLEASAYEEAARSGMQRLLQQLLSEAAHPFWRSTVYLLQLFDSVAVVHHGRLLSLTPMTPASLAAHKLPHAVAAGPLCVVAGQPAELAVSGHNISSPDCTLVVAGCGRHLHLAGVGPSNTSADTGCGCGCCSSPEPAANNQQQAGGKAGRRELVRCVVTPPAGACGVLWVEVARGAFLSEARPLLVVDDPALAQEVCSLQQLEGGMLSAAQIDCLLLDLALVLRHIRAASAGSTAAAAAGSALGHAAIADKARRLIAFAADQGWGAVARAVLPLAQACCSCATDIVAAVHASTAQDGLSLLHRAVRSGSPSLVRGILDWGAANGYAWPIAAGGPGGLTPLHLAALLEDDGVVALLLLDAADDPGRAFTGAAADDGVTPFQLAFQVGHYSLDRVLAGLGRGPAVTSVVEQQLDPTGWQLLKAAADEQQQLEAGGAAPPGKRGGGGGRAGAGGGGALKERHTSCLDACLYCQSTLPPLLLSIKAHCAGCGVRQPCVTGDEPGSPLAPPAAAVAAAAAAAAAAAKSMAAVAMAAAAAVPVCSSAATCGGGLATSSLVPVCSSAATCGGGLATSSLVPGVPGGLVPAGPADDDGCAHATGRVLSVTALCQTCHANRVLEVA